MESINNYRVKQSESEVIAVDERVPEDGQDVLFCDIDVLDKIRAEIEEYKSRQLALAIGIEDLEKGKQTALEYVLAILDKYKTESEG